MNAVITGLRDSTSILGDGQALIERARDEGYLFFPGLLPREPVLELRADIIEICRRRGWMAEVGAAADGTVDTEAVAKLSAEEVGYCGVGIPKEAYAEVWKLESFHRLAHRSELIALYETLFGAEVFVHPRNIARVMLPSHASNPTPPHQDYIHIQGTKNVWTGWIPIGDIPRDLGGLSILEGSNRDGILPVKAAAGAGGLEAYLCELECPWIEHDFQAGDVLTFTSLTVHRSIPNRMHDRLRISCDYRYQPAHEAVEAKSLVPHCNVLEWDEVYRDWGDDSLVYYWKRRELLMAEWDDKLKWQTEKIC